MPITSLQQSPQLPLNEEQLCFVCMEDNSKKPYLATTFCPNEGGRLQTIQDNLQVGIHGPVHPDCLDRAIRSMENACPICRLPNIRSTPINHDVEQIVTTLNALDGQQMTSENVFEILAQIMPMLDRTLAQSESAALLRTRLTAPNTDGPRNIRIQITDTEDFNTAFQAIQTSNTHNTIRATDNLQPNQDLAYGQSALKCILGGMAMMIAALGLSLSGRDDAADTLQGMTALAFIATAGTDLLRERPALSTFTRFQFLGTGMAMMIKPLSRLMNYIEP